jgi:hypothetical protein
VLGQRVVLAPRTGWTDFVSVRLARGLFDFSSQAGTCEAWFRDVRSDRLVEVSHRSYGSTFLPDGQWLSFTFAAGRDRLPGDAADHWYVVLPFWLLVLIFGLMPSWASVRYVRRRRATAAFGHCPACGYDLRATPERCPECGTVVANAPLDSAV